MSQELSDEQIRRIIEDDAAEYEKRMEQLERYTDYIDMSQEVFCWEFSLSAGDDIYDTVKTELLRGLKALSESKNRRLRDRRFTIALGDDAVWYYYVAITRPATDLTRFLNRYLIPIEGYDTSEFAFLNTVKALPRLRYEAGQVIEYSDADLAGTWRDDDDDWYGSGLRIQYRYAQPSFLLGSERYAGKESGS